MGVMDTGWVSSRVSGESILGTAVTQVFQFGGVVACCEEALAMEVSGLENSGANSFSRDIGMSLRVTNLSDFLPWILWRTGFSSSTGAGGRMGRQAGELGGVEAEEALADCGEWFVYIVGSAVARQVVTCGVPCSARKVILYCRVTLF